jgi:hypothetical protein
MVSPPHILQPRASAEHSDNDAVTKVSVRDDMSPRLAMRYGPAYHLRERGANAGLRAEQLVWFFHDASMPGV